MTLYVVYKYTIYSAYNRYTLSYMLYYIVDDALYNEESQELSIHLTLIEAVACQDALGFHLRFQVREHLWNEGDGGQQEKGGDRTLHGFRL